MKRLITFTLCFMILSSCSFIDDEKVQDKNVGVNNLLTVNTSSWTTQTKRKFKNIRKSKTSSWETSQTWQLANNSTQNNTITNSWQTIINSTTISDLEKINITSDSINTETISSGSTEWISEDEIWQLVDILIDTWN